LHFTDLMNPFPFRCRALLILLSSGLFVLAAAPLCGASRESAPPPELADQPRSVVLPPGGVSVPMRLVNGKPVVEVRLDGRGPFPFFLDTGAGATVIDAVFAAELALPGAGTTKIGDPTDPEGITAAKHRVDLLEIGGARFESFFAVAFDRSGLYAEGAPRGVLGMPLFRDCLLTLDYPGGTVRLVDDRLPASNGREILDYRPSETDLFGLQVRVAGTEYWMTVDSGSPGSFSFPDAFRATLPLVAPARELGRGRTVGGEAIVYGAELDGAVELGAIRLERPQVRFFGRLTHGNLGSGFLARYAVSIDQRTRRMRFVPGAPAPTLSAAGPLARYVGSYGERKISLENGRLFLQRVTGPQGEGPRIELTEVTAHHFALAGQTEPRLEFVVTPEGAVIALRIQTREGGWENAPRDPLEMDKRLPGGSR
jgi:hypothetical protein